MPERWRSARRTARGSRTCGARRERGFPLTDEGTAVCELTQPNIRERQEALLDALNAEEREAVVLKIGKPERTAA